MSQAAHPPIYIDYLNRLDIEALAITDDEIRLAGEHRGEHRRQVLGVVGHVGIDHDVHVGDHIVKGTAHRIPLPWATLKKHPPMGTALGQRLAGKIARVVRGAVVHDHDLRLRQSRMEAADHLDNGECFVVGWDDQRKGWRT